jgi:NAD(P)-dependent dehydrogenase (short-subunit alcohol dehydrogenase family)
MRQFAGKVAVITGGNAGIGRATAIAFATQGATVVVSGRREQEGRDVVTELKALGGEAIFITTDVSQAREVTAMIDQTLATFGRLDSAFNNADIGQAPQTVNYVPEGEGTQGLQPHGVGGQAMLLSLVPARGAMR